MNQHKQIAIQALHAFKGDNHIRARRAFAGLSADEMQKPHGSSGQSRAEVLAGYEAHARRVEEAIEYLCTAQLRDAP